MRSVATARRYWIDIAPWLGFFKLQVKSSSCPPIFIEGSFNCKYFCDMLSVSGLSVAVYYGMTISCAGGSLISVFQEPGSLRKVRLRMPAR